MEIEAGGKSPSTAALEVLETNAALMREQIALSREQIGLARNERFRNRIRSIRDIAIAAVVVALIVAMGAVVWSASRTTGLVIQPFSVPPALAEDGLDGRAVAALFQDELVRLEAATTSERPQASFRNDWSQAISVEVEAGGLSLTESYRALVRWLGSETTIDGSLRRTTTGLELVVRTSDGTAIAVQSPADRPETLIRNAAERIYEQTQPYRFSGHLENLANALPPGPERQALLDRRRAILSALLSSPSETERLWGYIGLAYSDDITVQDGMALSRAALRIDPEHPIALGQLERALGVLGHNEARLLHARRAAASGSSPRNLAKIAAERQESFRLEAEERVAELEGDFLTSLERSTRLTRLDSRAANGFRDNRVNALISLHQPSALRGLIEDEAQRAAGRSGPGDRFSQARIEAAVSLDQWPQAAALLEAVEVETPWTQLLRISPIRQTSIWPRLAYARARTGDLAGAQALIAATPLDCYLCVRQRAQIAELAGDRPAADRWSAEARRQGPSLPFAFAERGQMLMARGDPAGAIAFYEQAVERGPRWADPQKYWGDALMAPGRRGRGDPQIPRRRRQGPAVGRAAPGLGPGAGGAGETERGPREIRPGRPHGPVRRRPGRGGAAAGVASGMIPHAVWPVDPAVILPFLVAVALIELTPGPNMGWLALVSLSRGRPAGFAAVAGVTVGLAVWMLAAAFGLTQALLIWPPLFQLIRWAGVGFLLWLAWEAWRGDSDPAAPDGGDLSTLRGLFLRGLTGNLLNPKAAVFYVALLPTFMRPDHGAPLVQALTLGGLHLVVAVVVHSAIVLGAARVGGLAPARMQGPVLRGVMAAGIAVVALWMAWETRG